MLWARKAQIDMPVEYADLLIEVELSLASCLHKSMGGRNSLCMYEASGLRKRISMIGKTRACLRTVCTCVLKKQVPPKFDVALMHGLHGVSSRNLSKFPLNLCQLMFFSLVSQFIDSLSPFIAQFCRGRLGWLVRCKEVSVCSPGSQDFRANSQETVITQWLSEPSSNARSVAQVC